MGVVRSNLAQIMLDSVKGPGHVMVNFKKKYILKELHERMVKPRCHNYQS
jgi:hypothetical protein